jgi:hypothetical protein
MLELDNARLYLINATPDPGQWQGAAKAQFEAQLSLLMAELSALRESLWS